MKRAVLFCFLCLLPLSSQSRAQAPPERSFRVYERQYEPGMRITPYLSYQLDAAWRQDDMRRSQLEAISIRTDLLEYRRGLRSRLLENLGGLPDEKAPLNARVTGNLDLDGYRIEKVVFESFPGFRVTALLYLPAGLKGRAPAVLLSCGHSPIGKAHPGYQQIAGRLAKRGYVVLCWDPVGQGERSQFWDSEQSDSRFNRVCGEHAIMGNLAYLAGANLVRWEVWDGIRAHDYLLTRPEVDPSRVAVTGTSGGGVQSSFQGALDERVSVSLPSCYISSLPMRMANRIFADPDSDPEQDLYRMVSDGIDHAGLLVLTWPRPVAVSAAVLDFFPIEGTRKTFREVETLYRHFGRPENIMLTEGYHQHSFSSHNQENAFAFLDRHFGIPPRWSLDSTKVLTDRELWVTRSGQVRLEYPDERSFTQVLRDYWKGRKESGLEMTLVGLYRDGFYPGIESWSVVEDDSRVPDGKILWRKTGTEQVGQVSVDRYVLRHSTHLSIPLLHFRKGVGDGRVMFWFTLDGKAGSKDWPRVRELLDRGFEVVSFDFRALGENRLDFQVVSVDDPRLAGVPSDLQYFSQVSGVLANYIYNSLLTGRPYFLQMIEDIEIAGKFSREALGAKRISVTGAGDAATLAGSAAAALPGLEYEAAPDARPLRWSELVDNQREEWPIHYLLPYGAYIN